MADGDGTVDNGQGTGDGTGTGDGAGTGDGTGAGGGGDKVFSWRGSLGEEYQSHATLASYEDTEVGLNNLAKTAIEGQKMIGRLTGGRQPLWMPSEKSTDEEKAEFRTALGIPDSVDAYTDITKPEELPEGFIFDEADVGAFREIALKRDLRPDQAKGIFDDYMEVLVGKYVAGQAKAEEDFKAAAAGLRKEWGMGYDKKLALADRALKTFGDESTIEFLQQTGLANHPGVVKMLASFADAVSEDRLQKGEGGKGGDALTPQEAQRQIAKVQKDPAYLDAHHPEHQAVVDQYVELTKFAYPK